MLSEQIMKSSPFSRAAVSIATVVIIAIGAYNWAISPHTAYLHAEEKYQAMSDTVGKKTLLLKKTLSIKEKKLQSLEQELMEFKTVFFSASEGVDFFSNLESVAEQNGCNIKLSAFKSASSTVADKIDTDGVMITPRNVTIRYTGKYVQIIQFLRYLNDYPKRVSVSDLRIESPPDGGTILDCSMNIVIYIIENQEPVTDE